ncbi:MAG: VOC family protein, partial [Proteobacteria bacterium]|nr:VOC family protein [Pseudomonadota bacterium]
MKAQHAARLIMGAVFLAASLLSGCDVPGPSGMHMKGVMHANINCSSYARSASFYKKLGFLILMEVEDSVTAEFAKALDLPPYTIHASPIMLPEGGMIDLIEWVDPFDPGAPYAGLNHPGIAAVSLATTNIDSDVEKLKDSGVEFISDPVTAPGDGASVRFVYFKDPDGTLLQLIQTGSSKKANPDGMNITAIEHININTTGLAQSLDFYTGLGCTVVRQYGDNGSAEYAAAFGMTSFKLQGALLSLRKGPRINLIEWSEPADAGAPYAHLNHLGIARIALQTKDLDADVSLLEKSGVEFFAQPMKPEGNLGFLRFACFKEASGV